MNQRIEKNLIDTAIETYVNLCNTLEQSIGGDQPFDNERRQLNKVILASLGIAVGGFFLAACGSAPETKPTKVPTTSATPTSDTVFNVSYPLESATPTPLKPSQTAISPSPTATSSRIETTNTPTPIDRRYLSPEQQTFLADHPINIVDANRNMFGLTYDDFPTDPNQLATILNSLRDNHVHATFFLIGHNLDDLNKGKLKAYGWPNADLIKRIIAEGHEIGCHTFTHGTIPLTQMHGTRLDAEFSLWLDAMDQIIPGYQPAFFRAPGGAFDNEVLRAGARFGMQHALWNEESGGLTIQATLTNVLGPDKSKPGNILLSHMMRYGDVTASKDVIPGLVQQGLILDTLSNGIKPNQKLNL